MKTNIKILFKSEPAMLAPVRALVFRYLTDQGLSHDRARAVTLAVDEACANAVRHAYGGATDGDVSVSLRTGASRIEVVVADKGKPMPAQHRKLKSKRPPVDAARCGGFGMHIIGRVFDDVSITVGEKKGNRIRMRLFMK